jgi:monoamine oxidase
MNVIVVGAGLAGLHAAWRLQELGHRVEVLEARERVGGRTFSHELPDGTVVERGGEFIAPSQDAIRGLAAELGIELIGHGLSFDRRDTPGRGRPTVEEREEVIAAVTRAAAGLDGGDRSVADVWADALGPDAHEHPLYLRLATSMTVPLDQLSARATIGEHDHGYDDADRVLGGNQRLSLELASRMATPVRTGVVVTGVRQDGGGVEVLCEGGETVVGDAAVIAVPLPVLRELDVELPAAVREAMAATLFGDAAKLHLPLRAGAQPDSTAAPGEQWWIWNSAAPGEQRSGPVLSGFAGGAGVAAALRVGDGPQTWAAAAAALRPDAEPAEGALVTHWGAERFTGGSYSVPAVGWTPDHDRAYEQPFGRLMLAGEHTAGPRAASMDGAVHSGARAAAALAASAGGEAPRG